LPNSLKSSRGWITALRGLDVAHLACNTLSRGNILPLIWWWTTVPISSHIGTLSQYTVYSRSATIQSLKMWSSGFESSTSEVAERVSSFLLRDTISLAVETLKYCSYELPAFFGPVGSHMEVSFCITFIRRQEQTDVPRGEATLVRPIIPS
jgi:hypothetical protein